MFDTLKVPTIAVVENMVTAIYSDNFIINIVWNSITNILIIFFFIYKANFICEKCNHVHYPFGNGYINALKN